MTETPDPPRVIAHQIADLLAWARSVSESPPDADPGERAAFQATKVNLLGRLLTTTAPPRRWGEG